VTFKLISPIANLFKCSFLVAALPLSGARDQFAIATTFLLFAGLVFVPFAAVS